MKCVSVFRRFQDISIAKKLYFTVGIMALLVGIELVALVFSLNTLSSVRAYVGGEGLWSKAQKDAVFHLYKYGVTRDHSDYLLFKDFMSVPLGDRKAREELGKDQPDLVQASQGLLEGRNHPEDIDGMIDLFRTFSEVYYIKQAITIWGQAEATAMLFLPIAEDLRAEIESPSPSQETIDRLLMSIDPINQRITKLEDDFSYTLGEGSRWLEGIVFNLLFVVAVTVETTGLLLTISVSRNMHKGLREIISAADSFANQTYATRAKVFSQDEIGVVASAFNRMSDELERSINGLNQARKRFRTLVEEAPDAIVISDMRGKIILVNAQTEKIFGCQREDLLNQSIDLLLPPRLQPRRVNGASLMDQVPTAADSDFYCRRSDGTEFPVEISLSQLETADGPLVSAAIRDVSERRQLLLQRAQAQQALQLRVSDLAKANDQLRHEIAERERAETELRRTFALLHQHVNNTPLGVIEWEQDAGSSNPRIQRWSGRAEVIFGWDEAEVLGKSAEEIQLFLGDDSERAAEAGRNLAKADPPCNSLRIRCYTKDRRIRHCRWYNSAVSLGDSGRTTILSLIEDATERVAALEDIYRLAHRDTLTGLPNRVTLHDRLRQALMSAKRRREGVAIMMIDLDHFKNVNDVLGHAIGDELLKDVANRMAAKLRASDTLARVGGDEFVLIQPDLVDRRGTDVVAQKIVDAFAAPFQIQGNRLDIGVSIGVTVYPDDGLDADQLLRNADIALYRAKHDGRGHYRCYSPEMDAELKSTRSLEAGLRHAIENHSLELYYQPKFALKDNDLRGVEALIRWQHAGGGHVPPASFIPVAEMSGLIVPLGEWVLREACRQAKTWIDAGWRLQIAVNVSAVQLRQAGFAGLLRHILKDTGLEASALEIEVTENVFLDASKTAIAKTLHDVADLGVHLAIDDFGTGYSSLGYLKHFPFDRIKIDKSFVRDIGTASDADAIVKAIIALGRSLGKSVTAEGVETERQLVFLRANGCDEAQGYLLAKPKPLGDVEKDFVASTFAMMA